MRVAGRITFETEHTYAPSGDSEIRLHEILFSANPSDTFAKVGRRAQKKIERACGNNGRLVSPITLNEVTLDYDDEDLNEENTDE